MRLRFPVLLFAFCVLLLVPARARAQGGINLSWDDCGTSGHKLKAFACNTNSGSDALYASVMTVEDLAQCNGVELDAYVMFSNASSISPWWHLESGGCRTGLSGRFDFTSRSSCYDLWGGQAAGGTYWQSAFNAPNQARLRGVAAIPGSTLAPASTEMYVFAFVFNHLKTVGTGSCSGCSDPACILLNSVKLTQPLGVGDYTFTQPITRADVSWACPTTYNYGGAPFEPPPGCVISCSVPARTSSWGSIKSMYR